MQPPARLSATQLATIRHSLRPRQLACRTLLEDGLVSDKSMYFTRWMDLMLPQGGRKSKLGSGKSKLGVSHLRQADAQTLSVISPDLEPAAAERPQGDSVRSLTSAATRIPDRLGPGEMQPGHQSRG